MRKIETQVRLQKQPNQASCVPTAFAMALEISVEDIFKELGHNGMAIWWPDQECSKRYRGFHIQEMIDVCFNHGWVITPIEPQPTATPCVTIKPRVYELKKKSLVRIYEYLDNKRGVLIGDGHAAAWIDGMVHDPNGTTYGIEDFGIREFWMMTRIGEK